MVRMVALSRSSATTVAVDHFNRSFSSVQQQQPPPYGSLRGFPQYTIFGMNCMMAIKAIVPGYRLINNNLSIEKNKKGRFLLEFTPRQAGT
jgi:hypothetical protein